MENNNNLITRQLSTPNPDPTVLTTAAILREIENVALQTGTLVTGTREVLETRLEGMDKAIALLQQSTDKYPSFVRAEVKQLQELHEEKFGSIAVQFAERDKRTEQLSLADKTAIAAALQAQKEAAGAQNESNAAANIKMETNFSKLIDQGGALLLEVRRNTEAQINDLKSRLDKGEGHAKGGQDHTAFIFSLIGMGVSVITVLVVIFKVIT